MKLNAALLLCMSAAIAAAQTSATKPASRTTARRPASAVRKPAAAACADLPTLGATVPKVEGCPKALYALRYIDTVAGTGTAVSPRKWLTVNYTGYLTDGTKFDSSLGDGPDGKPREPITFPYGARQVIAGWDTGFEGMNIGGKRRLFIPYELAYGEAGRPPVIPARSPLIFDIELLAISDTPPAPKTPPVPPPTKPETPGSAIPPTTAPPVNPPVTPPASAPATDPTKPTAIPPTTTPPAMQTKPQR